jgi:HEAT repeat protein
MSGVCIIGQMAAASGWKEFVPVLVKALDSEYCGSERNRMSILRSLSALAESGDAAVIAAVRQSLAMEFPYMLNEAAELAGRLGDKESIPRLRELLDHPFLVVRRRAAVALGRLGDTASAPQLRESLSRIRKPEVLDHTRWGTRIWQDENMRAGAAEGLGEMRDPASAAALREALEREPVPWVREVMAEALKKIEGKAEAAK